jgi:prophage tail gpP-like protein
MDEEVTLVVGGFRYAGWKSVRVTRSIESLAGAFALDVSDRWDGEEAPWPIVEEDACRVEIDGEVVIDGYVDKRSLSASKDSRALSYTGRDRAAALVDCSAVLSKWTYRNVNVADFAAIVARPFGISVSVQPGLVLPKVPKLVVSPGDTAYEVIKRAAGDDGVLIVSDGAGGILITRAGDERAATSLVEGMNILSASVDYDGADRFHQYLILTQAAGTDNASGDATRVQAEYRDDGVRRTERVLLMRPEKGYSVADAKRRAGWEARIRAARAETVTVVVRGWKQSNGELWPLNAVTRVVAPRLIGVEGDMRITQAEHSIGEQGRVTQLRLVRPDAFTPAPTVKAPVNQPGRGRWWR